MMSALEKAESAVDDALSDAFHANRQPDPSTIARAVLMAVREPGDVAIRAMCVATENTPLDDPWGPGETDGYDSWRSSSKAAAAAMIDAILRDHPLKGSGES